MEQGGSSNAVIFAEPGAVRLDTVDLAAPGPADIVVDVDWSGISTGTERLLWSGRMPPFPGLAYPLVPGYESVGRVVEAGPLSERRPGETVFVPGARCFPGVSSLFGATASRLVTAGERAIPVDEALGAHAVLFALAATAHHAVAGAPPELVVGNGVLGRLVARVTTALGHAPPTVWEREPTRRQEDGAARVIAAELDERRDYARILDASGDGAILDTLVGRLARGGEIVLAGFYAGPLSFAFPAAFMREARLRCSAEFRPADLDAVVSLVDRGALSLDGLVTHRAPAADAAGAYRTAFGDVACLKMVLDWKLAA